MSDQLFRIAVFGIRTLLIMFLVLAVSPTYDD